MLTLKTNTGGSPPTNKALSIEVVGTPGNKQITFSGQMISIQL